MKPIGSTKSCNATYTDNHSTGEPKRHQTSRRPTNSHNFGDRHQRQRQRHQDRRDGHGYRDSINSTYVMGYEPEMSPGWWEWPTLWSLEKLKVWASVLRSFLSRSWCQWLSLASVVAMAMVCLIFGTREPLTSKLSHKSGTNDSYLHHTRAGDIMMTNSRTIRGYQYQAQSQVSIPREYSHFGELAEFAETVAFVRMHRKQQQQQQQQQQQHRRLDRDAINRDEEVEDEEMNHAINTSWEKALLETNTTIQQQPVKYIPFFWHIPRSGGTTLSTLLGTCLDLVLATSSYSSPSLHSRWEDPALASRFRDPTLYVLRMGGQQFVNVDLNNFEGVQMAVKGKLISNQLADLVVMQDVRLGSMLFQEEQEHGNSAVPWEGDTRNHTRKPQDTIDSQPFKGVLFAMFRHPIDRAVSVFYNKQQVRESVHFDPSMEIYSLTDWINSRFYVNDYMVRSLVGKLNEKFPENQPPLSQMDLDVAKEILRRKCIIGLLDEKGASMKRFEKFFGWSANEDLASSFLFHGEDTTTTTLKREKQAIVKDEECEERFLNWNWLRKHKYLMLDESESSYRLLESRNRYDLELYLYARQLFDEQYEQLGFDEDDMIEYHFHQGS